MPLHKTFRAHHREERERKAAVVISRNPICLLGERIRACLTARYEYTYTAPTADPLPAFLPLIAVPLTLTSCIRSSTTALIEEGKTAELYRSYMCFPSQKFKHHPS